jgi:subtilisin family serine protease
MRRRGAFGVTVASVTAVVVALGTAVVAMPVAAREPVSKIEAALARTLDTKPSADFWLVFGGEADLSGAGAIKDWGARGAAVVDSLRETADRSQAAVRRRLTAAGADFDAYYIANAILVRNGAGSLAEELAKRAEITRVVAARSLTIPEPTRGEVERQVDTVEWGIAAINADDVWSGFGVRGEGMVVANIDTGVQYDHPALVAGYRGNAGGGGFDHNYNWFDPARVCGNPSLVPCDNHGHGTHTMGSMVGDDGAGNQIGVAPGARWIAAKGCATNACSDATLLAAGQWILAPTDLAGANPRPDLRPNVVNNSWGGGEDDFWYQAMVNAWRAAGIFPAFSSGNEGPGCDTAGSPGDYTAAYATGAFDINGSIASFSSRGPGEGGSVKPNLAAPGVNVRSSEPGNGYASSNGTSMASPHTAGTVALMWSAAPALTGDIAETELLLDATAVDTGNLACGGTDDDNNVWGEGRLDAFAAVQTSPRGPAGILTGTVSDAGGGDPVEAATVHIAGPVTRDLVTGSDGSYRSTLPVGDYTVTVSAFGYVDATASATLTEGATTRLDLPLTALARFTVRGHVLDSAGNPVRGATVAALGVPIPPVTTGAEGGYAIPDVPVGGYQVRASASTCTAPQTLAVTVDGDETLDFALPVVRDGFGYQCRPETGGYVEGDTPVALTGDDAAATIPLPFSFFLYGRSYQQAFVSTNGHVNFLAPSTAFSNAAIPSTAAPNGAIYAFWDDLRIDAGSQVLTRLSGTAPNREFLIEWRNATFFNAATLRVDVQAVLAESGELLLRYRNLDPAQPRETGGSATVGIENQAGTTAFQYSLNTPTLADSQAIRFIPPATGRITGTVTDVNDGQPVAGATVRALADGAVVDTTVTGADGGYRLQLVLGTYTVEVSNTNYLTDTGSVTLSTPGQVVTRDAALHTPRADLTPSALSFLAQEGQLRTALLTLTSTSELPLTFAVTDQASWLWTVPGSGTVAAGSPRTLTTRVDPTGLEPGSVYGSTLTLATNAGRTPTITVPVTLVVPAYRTGIDAGGSASTDSAGDLWVSDQAWTAGGYGYLVRGRVIRTRRAIAGTVDDTLYQTSREATGGYRFDTLPAGNYTVELGFAELERGLRPGRRVFDVTVNGQPVLVDYDIAARVGTLVADRHQVQVEVADGGSIEVQLVPHPDKRGPVINAVRVTHRPDL